MSAQAEVALLDAAAAERAIVELADVLADCVAGGASVSFMQPFGRDDGVAYFRKVAGEIESAGGRMNAGTSYDYTYYHMIVPASQALAGIDLLADISVNASLDAAVLDAEKRVVLEEMRLSEDNPRRFLAFVPKRSRKR